MLWLVSLIHVVLASVLVVLNESMAVKDVYTKIFYLIDLKKKKKKPLLRTDNDLLASEIKIKTGCHRLHFREFDFDKLVHIIQQDLWGF